jgi:lysozyme
MTYTVQGCDISVWNDDISTPQHVDFNKMLAAGAKFVFIKASQACRLDRDYTINSENARLAGIPRGFYHYMDWTRSAVDQARFFAGVIQSDPGELPAVLDCEEQKNAPADSASKFMVFCHEYFVLTGKQVMIYTSNGYWGEHGSTDRNWLEHKLWLANYPFFQPPPPTYKPIIPKPWTEYRFWQYTSRGDGYAYGGEEPYMDLNEYPGTVEEMNAEFGISGSIPPSPTDPVNYLIGKVVSPDGLWLHTIPSTAVNTRIRVMPKGESQKIVDMSAPKEMWGKNENGEWFALTYDGVTLMEVTP